MPARDEAIYFKAVLRPNPPLPPRACLLLLAVVGAVNVAIAVLFILQGAWPVTPFLGIDLLILAWAFFSSSRAAQAREELELEESELRVRYYPARGKPRQAELNPYWVRVQVHEPFCGRSAIRLATHGRYLQIGSSLSCTDRASLAKALIAALGRIRQTRDLKPRQIPSTSAIE